MVAEDKWEKNSADKSTNSNQLKKACCYSNIIITKHFISNATIIKPTEISKNKALDYNK
ncbi:hypothetical protein [Moellerella wisconsensis]|uniref:hypothetical protein n=1 Tax=Moellerella wisconsensis TaxID=158849 RepID=UPI0012E205E6|nr:hypothetical protein [Moellerella wisconsensis]